MLKNYWLYYCPSFYVKSQHGDNFDYIGDEYFRYFTFSVSMYKAQKTRLPAFIITVLVFGYGFGFCTHDKR